MVSLVIRANSAVGIFQGNSDPVWEVVPAVVAAEDEVLNIDLSQYVSDSDPLIYSISPDSPSNETEINAAGLTLDPETGILSGTYNGDPLSIIVRATEGSVSTVESDWLARSTAEGVFFETNFSWQDNNHITPITNAAGIIASSWDGVVQAREDLLEFDTTHKLSGTGSMRQNLLAAEDATITSYVGYRIGWDGLGAETKNTSKSVFYFQFAYYIDEVWHGHYFNTGNYGGKIAIFQAPDSSFGTGEVVLRRDFRPGGWLGPHYRIPSGQSSLSMRLEYPGLSQRANYAFYDTGSPTNVTTLDQMQLRHGPQTQTSDSTGTDVDFQHAPKLIANGWTVVEVYINLVSQVVKIWMAPYGEAPVLVAGGMDYPGRSYMGLPSPGVDDGTVNGDLYSGVQLTGYMNKNQWTGGWDWPAQDTFICYDEIIASDNPINFPGGFTLPFPGTQLPTGWPPTDSSPAARGV